MRQRGPVMVRRLGPGALAQTWRRDYSTAREDLEASRSQAFLVALHAAAWRLSVVLLPVSVVVAALLAVTGSAHRWLVVVLPFLAVVGPQAVALLGSLPVSYWAMAKTFRTGSHDARIRFGTSVFVFGYYGWRYAFRRRRRPWGAMRPDERQRANPRRAAGS